MKHWQIEKVLYFSHHGRLREVGFNLRAPNIVVGPSGTGKSALLTTVDYALASTRVRIPHFVEIRCAAVGVVWALGDERLLVCRGTRTRRRSYWIRRSSGEMDLPASAEDLGQSMTDRSAREALRRAFGIGEAVQARDDEASTPMKVSVRHLMPYLMMGKEALSSEQYLLHGQSDNKSGRQVDDTIEYFLGVLDERTLTLEEDLRRYRQQLKRLMREQSSRRDAHTTSHERAMALVAQAQGLGLLQGVDPGTLSDEGALSALQEVLRVQSPEPEDPESAGAYPELAGQRDDIGHELAARRRDLRQTRERLSLADAFADTLDQQSQLLQPVRVFDGTDLETSCVVCGQEVGEPHEAVHALASALRSMADESFITVEQRNAEQARERWLKERISELQSSLASVERQMTAIARAADETDDRRLAHQIGWMRGRVSYYLDEVAVRQSDDLAERIAQLRELVDISESEVRSDEREVRRQLAEYRLSQLVERHVKDDLPHREPCNDASFLARLRPVELRLATSSGDVIDLPQVGSDENYLSIHLAFMVALHELFKEKARPVPSVVLVDQISRPFYPNETDEVSVEGHDADAEAIRQYFKFVFDSSARLGLQFIIIEHAYISDDPRYVDSVRHRWSYGGDKLIPEDWPIEG